MSSCIAFLFQTRVRRQGCGGNPTQRHKVCRACCRHCLHSVHHCMHLANDFLESGRLKETSMPASQVFMHTLFVSFCQKARAALTTIQITVNVKEGYILRKMCFIMLLQERRQALTEQALNQLNIVAHFWKGAAQSKVALKGNENSLSH